MLNHARGGGGQCDVTDAVPAAPRLASASCSNIITAPQGVGLPYFSSVHRLLSSIGNKYQYSRVKHAVWVTMQTASCAVNLVCSFPVSRQAKGKQTVLTALWLQVSCVGMVKTILPKNPRFDLTSIFRSWLHFSARGWRIIVKHLHFFTLLFAG